MEFNVDKWFVKHATHSKHKIQHQYTLHNQTLTPVKHSKYLGVTLSDDLTWRTHISNVVGDASALQNTQLPPQNSPHRISKHQRPCLQSTCSTKTRIRALYMGSAPRQVEECVRDITEPSRTISHTPMAHYNTNSVTAMKHDLGWEALADRRQLSRVILFYKIHHNLVLIQIPSGILYLAQWPATLNIYSVQNSCNT